MDQHNYQKIVAKDDTGRLNHLVVENLALDTVVRYDLTPPVFPNWRAPDDWPERPTWDEDHPEVCESFQVECMTTLNLDDYYSEEPGFQGLGCHCQPPIGRL